MLLATPPKIVLYPGNTQVINLTGLQDLISGIFLNAATVTATLVDDEGNAVSGCTGVTFTYVAASNGNYYGVFGDVNFQPPVGTQYTLLIDATQASDTGHWEINTEIAERQS